jgi:hypothetical protein
MWLLMEKPLPDNMDLVATCDVAGCLTHLVAASSVDALRTHCPQGHALSGDNLVPCVKRERRCLRCHRKQSREAAARYRARKKSNRTVGA